MTRVKMHQTTVRFGPELWDALERESRNQGVSIAQFVREAALARLIYMEARRADSPYGEAFAAATGAPAPPAPEAPAEVPPAVAAAGNMRSLTSIEAAESSALWAQARQARRRAKELRGQLTHRQRR